MCSVKEPGDKAKRERTEGCLCDCVFMMGCPPFPLSASGSAPDQHKRLLRFFSCCYCAKREKCWAKINLMTWTLDDVQVLANSVWHSSLTKTHRDTSCLSKYGHTANSAPHLIKEFKKKYLLSKSLDAEEQERNKPTCLCQRIGTSSPHTKHKLTEHNTDIIKDPTFNL